MNGLTQNKKGNQISLIAFLKSEKRDSNSRPQPWQGCALPTELFSLIESGLCKSGCCPNLDPEISGCSTPDLSGSYSRITPFFERN